MRRPVFLMGIFLSCIIGLNANGQSEKLYLQCYWEREITQEAKTGEITRRKDFKKEKPIVTVVDFQAKTCGQYPCAISDQSFEYKSDGDLGYAAKIDRTTGKSIITFLERDGKIKTVYSVCEPAPRAF